MIVKQNEPMSRHTSFRVGGPADRFLEPETEEELAAAVQKLRAGGGKFYVIGNGSNLLVSDAGFRGTVIGTERLDRIERLRISGEPENRVAADGGREEGGREGNARENGGEERIRAGAGVLLSRLAGYACREGLAGLAFAAGIPGSVGGAAVMNAGAYGSEMKDVLRSVTVLGRDGELRTLAAERLELGYRTSALMKNGDVVLAAEFGLREGSREEIQAQMAELARRRRTKQPLEYPSAGSTFKRPAGYFAGKLIEDAGLKGFSVGGAQVSEKHAGFVINRGDASAADIFRLCQEVRRRVRSAFGVELELEVRLLGDFGELV